MGAYGGYQAILIDPGEEPERLLCLVRDSGCRLKALLATHGHFDHIGAAAAIQAIHDLPLRCHPGDLTFIEKPSCVGQSDRSQGIP